MGLSVGWERGQRVNRWCKNLSYPPATDTEYAQRENMSPFSPPAPLSPKVRHDFRQSSTCVMHLQLHLRNCCAASTKVVVEVSGHGTPAVDFESVLYVFVRACMLVIAIAGR